MVVTATGRVLKGDGGSAAGEHDSDEYGRGKTTSGRLFWLPARKQLLIGFAFWSVILLGAILRFWGLGDKPLHHDESLHAYYSLGLLRNNIENWLACFQPGFAQYCYRYDPLLHGPFQFHGIALVYKISQWLGVSDHGTSATTARILAATLGTVIVGLPYFIRDRLSTPGAWIASLLLAVSPGMVYYSRFAREDIYMACFTLLLVVSIARYLSTRRSKWLIWAAIAFILSYATKEATFLTIAIYGSFLGAVLVWELGSRWPVRELVSEGMALRNWLPRTAAPILVLSYFVVLGIAAKWFFGWLKALSIFIITHQKVADAYVQSLKNGTVQLIPWIGMLLGAFVLFKLFREASAVPATKERRGLARWIDPEKQRWLDTIVTMPWTHWFFALICAWAIYLLLFTALFTNIRGGIGDGVWQGLYYWLQQQQVARGGQPWYYYLLLIPLYEQIGLVFGLVGGVRALLRPTRFRLFLVYWFVGNVFIYSWAAEKMPWLSIHLIMPMLLLAALGLEPAATTLVNLARQWWVARARQASRSDETVTAMQPVPGMPTRAKATVLSGAGAATTLVLALLLLLPTLQNMFQLAYIHQADAPHEMMIYVQTSTDINIVMAKIDALDQKLYHGQHKLAIGVTDEATWPFPWYLRDYNNVCYNFPEGCAAAASTRQVIIAAGSQIPTMQQQFGDRFVPRIYHLRTQWDQGYMMPRCIPSATNLCTEPQPYIGVGPLLWLSYGDNPPPGAKFDVGRAASNIWRWWWQRKAFGDTTGSFDMSLMIRSDLGVAP
ncbi:MAG: TIGR03663 family protein [Ktedonobacteraceae bacterium]|nr:TIGR03663 family protein [Ktedonobacteraceae bacterium]